MINHDIKKIKYYLKGVGTFFPYPFRYLFPTHQHQFCSTASSVRIEQNVHSKAAESFALWLRTIDFLRRERVPVAELKNVVEVGPGDSLGIGMMALLTVATAYTALDHRQMVASISNKKILNELISLLIQKTNIPGDEDNPKMYPKLSDYAITSELLATLHISPDHINAVGRKIEGVLKSLQDPTFDTPMIRYGVLNNWSQFLRKDSADFIFSNAVMEHVDDTRGMYQLHYSWLKSGGYAFHVIDFKSHGTAPGWDGHWAYGKAEWGLVRGASKYLINRLSCSEHLNLLTASGFDILKCERYRARSTISRSQLSSDFSSMSDEDLGTSTAVVLVQKS